MCVQGKEKYTNWGKTNGFGFGEMGEGEGSLVVSEIEIGSEITLIEITVLWDEAA